MIKRNFMTLIPTAANQWQRMLRSDENCIGTLIQNQQTQTTLGNIYVCNKEPSRLTDAILLAPSSILLEDILAGQEEVWVYTDTLGAVLTFNRKYEA